MNRLSRRSLAVIGAGAFAVALTVGGGGSAVAAPSSGQVGAHRSFVYWAAYVDGYHPNLRRALIGGSASKAGGR